MKNIKRTYNKWKKDKRIKNIIAHTNKTPKEKEEAIKKYRQKYYLDLKDENFNELPESIYHLYIRNLDLYGNEIDNLPIEKIAQIKSLHILRVDGLSENMKIKKNYLWNKYGIRLIG